MDCNIPHGGDSGGGDGGGGEGGVIIYNIAYGGWIITFRMVVMVVKVMVVVVMVV